MDHMGPVRCEWSYVRQSARLSEKVRSIGCADPYPNGRFARSLMMCEAMKLGGAYTAYASYRQATGRHLLGGDRLIQPH
jgi:hypothetical protein